MRKGLYNYGEAESPARGHRSKRQMYVFIGECEPACAAAELVKTQKSNPLQRKLLCEVPESWGSVLHGNDPNVYGSTFLRAVCLQHQGDRASALQFLPPGCMEIMGGPVMHRGKMLYAIDTVFDAAVDHLLDGERVVAFGPAAEAMKRIG